MKHPALLMANRACISEQKRTLSHLACLPSLALGGLAKTHTAQRLTAISTSTSVVLSSKQCTGETYVRAKQ